MTEQEKHDEGLIDLNRPSAPSRETKPQSEEEPFPSLPPPPPRRFRTRSERGTGEGIRDVTGADSFVDTTDEVEISPSNPIEGKQKIYVGPTQIERYQRGDWIRNPVTSVIVLIALAAIFWRPWVLPMAGVVGEMIAQGDYQSAFFALMFLLVPVWIFLRFRRSADNPSWDDNESYGYPFMYSGGRGCFWSPWR